MAQLARQLATENPASLANTYWIIDGAKYHRSPSTLERLKGLGLKVIVAGPYGFLGAPCEMVFGFLKQIDLNPANVKTGKK